MDINSRLIMLANLYKRFNSVTNYMTLFLYVIYFIIFKNNINEKILLLFLTLLNTIIILYLLFYNSLNKKNTSSNIYIFNNISNLLLNIGLIMFIVEDF